MRLPVRPAEKHVVLADILRTEGFHDRFNRVLTAFYRLEIDKIAVVSVHQVNSGVANQVFARVSELFANSLDDRSLKSNNQTFGT